MKNKLFISLLLPIFVLAFFVNTYGQHSLKKDRYRNETAWFVDVNAGITSYIGDWARYNFDPIYKIREESKAAFSINVGKSLNRIFTARVYFTMGGLKAYNNPLSIQYDAKLYNYGAQATLNFSSWIGKLNYVPDFYIYGIAGAGMAISKPLLYHIPTDSLIQTTTTQANASISTLEVNTGLGFSYHFYDNFDAYIELLYHHSFSDELDLKIDGKNDAFFHTLIGLKYRFAYKGYNFNSVFNRRRR
ncbi:MAG: hypothetical protein B7C24_04235 [Bacteroidetes bacterium 4572_77]|nr:MAG: hypothetical protein B7C24_04235 [Bacteroidetes bacterium 4572_77]